MTVRELISRIDADYLFYDVLQRIKANYYTGKSDVNDIYKYYTIAKDSLSSIPKQTTRYTVHINDKSILAYDDTDIRIHIDDIYWYDLIDAIIISDNNCIEDQLCRILFAITSNGYTLDENIKYVKSMKQLKKAYRDEYLDVNLISWEDVVELSKN